MAIYTPTLPFYNTSVGFTEQLKSRLALHYSKIGVWEYDASLNRVFFSEGSREIIGCSDPDFGKNPFDWNDRVHPEDQERFYQDFRDHLNGYNPMYENEHRIRCMDGKYKWIRDRGKIVEWNADGTYKRIIGTHTDITELKEKESKINEALSVATEHNNRLKGFAHIVTHNLKQHASNFETLINFINESDSEEERQDLMEHLQNLSKSFSKTVANLNGIVSSQTRVGRKVERIKVAQEIDGILEFLHPVIQQSRAIIHNNIDKNLVVFYNKLYFESIVQNLLTNAIKYKHPDRDPEITISCENTLDALILKIRDNGIGIDLKKYGKDLFGLYKTFHHNENAEGVGLYLIKNQIESFGGTITVDSDVNIGTTFSIIVNKLSHNNMK